MAGFPQIVPCPGALARLGSASTCHADVPMGFRNVWTAAALVAVTAVALPAAAQSIPTDLHFPTGPREETLHVWNGVAGGANPLVLGDMIKVFRKMPFGNGESLLTCDQHWRLGAMMTMSPAYMRPALLIGISPLLILDIDLSYGPGFNFLHYTFDNYRAAYGPDARQFLSPTVGLWQQFTAQTVFKAAYGPVLLLQLTDVNYFYSKEYFFHWEIGTILHQGWDVRSKTFLAFEVWDGIRLFANYEFYKYFGSGFRTQLASVGLLLVGMLPAKGSLLFQLGQHIENPDFQGAKLWFAMFWDWDFPLAKWKKD